MIKTKNLSNELYEILKNPDLNRKEKDKKLLKILIDMPAGAERDALVKKTIHEGFLQQLDEKPLRFILFDALSLQSEDLFLSLMALIRQQIENFPFDIGELSMQTIYLLQQTIDKLCSLYHSYISTDNLKSTGMLSNQKISPSWLKKTSEYLNVVKNEINDLEQKMQDYVLLNGELALLINNLDCCNCFDALKFQFLLNQVFGKCHLSVCFFINTKSNIDHALN